MARPEVRRKEDVGGVREPWNGEVIEGEMQRSTTMPSKAGACSLPGLHTLSVPIHFARRKKPCLLSRCRSTVKSSGKETLAPEGRKVMITWWKGLLPHISQWYCARARHIDSEFPTPRSLYASSNSSPIPEYDGLTMQTGMCTQHFPLSAGRRASNSAQV